LCVNVRISVFKFLDIEFFVWI